MHSYFKFAKQTFIIGLLNALGIVQTLFFLPIITKLLGAEDYGIWTQLKITMSLLIPFMFLGMNDSLGRFLPGIKDKDEAREAVYSTLVFTSIVTFASAALLMIFSGEFSVFLRFSPAFIKLLSLIIIFESLTTTFLVAVRSRREIKEYFWFAALKMFGETGLVIGAILLGYGLYGSVLSLLIIRIIFFLVLSVYIVKRIEVKIPDFSLIKKYLHFGLPTLIDMVSYWTITSADRYIIGFFWGVIFVGYYAPAYSIGTLLVAFMLPVSFMLSVVLPKFFDENNLEEVKKYLSYSLKYFLLIMIPSAFGLSVLSYQLLLALSTKEIAANAYFVVPFIAVSTLLYGAGSLIGHNLLLAKKTKLRAIIWIAAAFINLGLNIIFIPKFGILSAAIITFISYLCAFILIWHFSFKEFQFEIDWIFIIKSIAASVLMVLFIRWLGPEGLPGVILSVVLGVLIYGVLIFLFKGIGKKEINFLKDFIKNEVAIFSK